MTHNEPESELAWYYYWEFNPPELVWLCRECAEELGEKVQFASTDSLCDSRCWHCKDKELEHLAAVEEEEKLWRELERQRRRNIKAKAGGTSLRPI